ncbi:MAG: type II toxin-antitoxin system death-on-curing family toxin [Pontiella sp.]
MCKLAAGYAMGVLKNHPFLDENKRTGFMAAYVFLIANNMTFSAPVEEVVLQTLGLTGG